MRSAPILFVAALSLSSAVGCVGQEDLAAGQVTEESHRRRHDSGVRDSGVRDSGVADTGVRDTGTVTDTGTLAPVPADTVSFSGSFPTRTGRFTASLTVGGESRLMHLYVPTTRPAQPALLVLLHGTFGGGDQMLAETGAQALADRQGIIVAAPNSRWMPTGDWDHAGEATYWETHPNNSPDTNRDLLLVRAVLVAAQRAYNTDPSRVYALGHSNGAFFAYLTAMTLRDRIAAFASNAGGLVRCNTTLSCRFRGTGTSCSSFRTQPGYCACSGTPKPIAVTAGARRPAAWIGHGNQDDMVSVQYGCTLAQELTAAGHDVSVSISSGVGHEIPSNLAGLAWPFLAAHRRP